MSDTPSTPGSEPEVAPDGTDGRAVGGGVLSHLSRRAFLATGSVGVAAAGLASAVPGLSGLLATGESDAPAVSQTAGSAAAAAAPELEGDAAGAGQQVMAHVSDVSTGEMRLFVGNQTLTLRDPALARSLAQAARAAGG